MKRILFILLMLGGIAHAQFPTGYTGINARYDWLAGKFRALHIPAGTDTALTAGQYTGAGAILVDTSGSSQGVWYRMNNRWNKIGDNSNTLYNADDSIISNRTVYVNGISFPTRSLIFSQNSSANNTTAQPMTITMGENRFRLSKTLQMPGIIPDDFAPFQSVGRLLGSGTVNFSGAATRYRPLTVNMVGGFTNTTSATFNNGGNGGPTTLMNAEWQTDRTASQTITGWIGVYRSSLQFTGNTHALSIENFADYIAGQVMYGGRGTLTNRYQFYALSGKIDSVANSYAFYNAGSLDSNYFAGPIRAPNLPDSDSTAAKPVGRLSNGVLVDLPSWPGTTVAPTTVSVSTSTTLSAPSLAGTTVLTDCSGGDITHTFPSAASNSGRIYRIKKMDATANAFNITTLEGALSITTQYAGYVVQSDGTNWIIIGVF